jgi:hypothetical protein
MLWFETSRPEQRKQLLSIFCIWTFQSRQHFVHQRAESTSRSERHNGFVTFYLRLYNLSFPIFLKLASPLQNVYVNANHPGFVDSDLQRKSSAVVKTILKKLVLISTKDGAITQLYLATSGEVEEQNIKGKYYIPFGMQKEPLIECCTQENQTLLWDFSEAILKEKIPNYPGAGI